MSYEENLATYFPWNKTVLCDTKESNTYYSWFTYGSPKIINTSNLKDQYNNYLFEKALYLDGNSYIGKRQGYSIGGKNIDISFYIYLEKLEELNNLTHYIFYIKDNRGAEYGLSLGYAYYYINLTRGENHYSINHFNISYFNSYNYGSSSTTINNIKYNIWNKIQIFYDHDKRNIYYYLNDELYCIEENISTRSSIYLGLLQQPMHIGFNGTTTKGKTKTNTPLIGYLREFKIYTETSDRCIETITPYKSAEPIYEYENYLLNINYTIPYSVYNKTSRNIINNDLNYYYSAFIYN